MISTKFGIHRCYFVEIAKNSPFSNYFCHFRLAQLNLIVHATFATYRVRIAMPIQVCIPVALILSDLGKVLNHPLGQFSLKPFSRKNCQWIMKHHLQINIFEAQLRCLHKVLTYIFFWKDGKSQGCGCYWLTDNFSCHHDWDKDTWLLKEAWN